LIRIFIRKSLVEVNTYKAGDYCGELALIKGEPNAAKIIATCDVKVISLDRNSFKRLLGLLETFSREILILTLNT
jgi:cAMP-dependent protein kinase regulator